MPILCEAGSVIVFDKDLLHAGGPNLSADIRYALYARMRFEAT
jgi:ectoine hydroxylase-related dioxygenase (phytanoyl-CoA dioxygenase family)